MPAASMDRGGILPKEPFKRLLVSGVNGECLLLRIMMPLQWSAASLAAMHEKDTIFLSFFAPGGWWFELLEVLHTYAETLANIVGIDVTTLIQAYLER